MANDLAAFNSEAWSDRLVVRLDQVNIAGKLANRNWEGDLRNNKTVWVRTPGSISMASYTRGATISYNDLTPAKEAFTVNDGQYFAFEVDDLDRAQSDLNAMDIYTRRAVVAMNEVVETKILGAYTYAPGANIISGTVTGATAATGTAVLTSRAVSSVTVTTGGTGYGTTPPIVSFTGGGGSGARATAVLTAGAVSSVTINSGGINYTSVPTVTFSGGASIVLDSTTSTSTGIYPLFLRARAIMSNNNVPATQGVRWAVLDPNALNLLLADTNHFLKGSDMGDAIVQYGLVGGAEVARRAADTPGFVGMCAGFAVYETAHVPKSGATKFLLFGDNEAISYAAQITEIEILRLQTTFANAVRGLLLHDTFVPAEAGKRLVVIKASDV